MFNEKDFANLNYYQDSNNYLVLLHYLFKNKLNYQQLFKWEELYEEIKSNIYDGGGIDVQCRCGTIIPVVEHQVNYNCTDQNGNFISPEACEHLAKYRTRCDRCKTNFCANCKIKPYHVGYSCSEYREYIESDRCRYCDAPTKTKRRGGAFRTVCKSRTCKDLVKNSCDRILPCGHYCKGFRKERKCLPCLHPECVNDDPDLTLGENNESFCLICYATGIGTKPSIQLNCKHIFHLDCLLDKVKSKWSGPRINFQYKKCPACKANIDIKHHNQLFKLIEEADELEQRVKNKAIERGKADGLDKDPRLEDPDDVYFGKFEEYILDKMSFFLCFDCKLPYFGGMRECGDNAGADGNYKKEDLICGGCAAERMGGQSTCTTHGTDYIEYKCRYCCEIAQWFCFGTTHFCQPCHSIVNKVSKKCPGPPTCTIKIKHPDDGSEFPLGCGLCRNIAFATSAV